MYCPKCKVEVPANSKFCLQCGERLYVNERNLKNQNKPGTLPQPSGSNQPNHATCYVDECLFQKPNIESPLVAQLSKGDILSIINEEGEFYHTKLETGEQKGVVGYVGMWVVTPPENEEQQVSATVISVNTPNRGTKQKESKKTSEKNMTFLYTGNGADLLWNGLGWLILTAITVGIYTPWAINNFCRYVTEHTEIVKS